MLAGLLAVVWVAALYRGWVGPRIHTWGAHDDEIAVVLPGDELLAVGHAAFDMAHFVMEQKMMRGIRKRAERTGREQTAAAIRTYAARSTRLSHDPDVELNHA